MDVPSHNNICLPFRFGPFIEIGVGEVFRQQNLGTNVLPHLGLPVLGGVLDPNAVRISQVMNKKDLPLPFASPQ